MGDPDLIFWVFFLLALMPFAVAAGWLAGGVRRRRPMRPLPGLWWVCGACRSVNPPDRGACYACGAPLPGDPETLPTDPAFTVVQRFGPKRPVEEMTVARPGARSAHAGASTAPIGPSTDDRPTAASPASPRDGSAPPSHP